jgi:putative hydrolase of the HAD superfamily
VKHYCGVLFDLFYTLLYDEGTGTREKAMEVARAAGIAPEDWLRGWRAGRYDSDRGAIPSLFGRVRRALSEVGYEDADGTVGDRLTGLLLARYSPALYPDARRTLSEARRRGYKVGLVSNLSRSDTLWLYEFELDSHFDALVLSCEVGAAKPEPEIYRVAAECLGVAPEQCVFVDDVPSYVAAAKAVGMTGVRINRFGSEEPYLEYGSPPTAPDLSIENLGQLLEWLPARAGRPPIAGGPR